MSADELNPAPLGDPPGWQPPDGPPIPPERDSSAPYWAVAPLAGFRWSVGTALWIVIGFALVLVGAAVAAGVVGRTGLDEDWAIVASGLILSSAYVAGVVGVWMLARSRGSSLAAAVGLRSHGAGRLLGTALFAAVLGRLLAGAWGLVLQALGADLSGFDLDPTKLFGQGTTGTVMLVLVAVVLAPVAEEIVFRGVLLNALVARWGIRVAIVGSSLAFSVVHLSLVAIPAVFLFALVLGWLFVRTRSLVVCIVAHALFNGLGLAAVYALKAAGAA